MQLRLAHRFLHIDDMRGALRADGLMASFGYAFYNVNDNFDEICNLADSRMYEDKKRYKHRTSIRDNNTESPQ